MDPTAEKDFFENFKSLTPTDQEELLIKLAQTYKGSAPSTNNDQENTSSNSDEDDEDEDEEESYDEQIEQVVDDFVPAYSEFPKMN